MFSSTLKKIRFILVHQIVCVIIVIKRQTNWRTVRACMNSTLVKSQVL